MTVPIRCRLALACLPVALAACGGDSAAAPDTESPYIVLTSVGITSGTAFLEATAGDNVKVTSVKFLIDGNDVGGSVQQNNDGTWLHEMDATSIPAGTHVVTAVAYDAAGNSGQGTTSLVVAPPASATPDTVPPAVTATIDGSFGLAKLTAIATDDVQVSSVVFYVDGQSTGVIARHSYMGSDPANQYFTIVDTSGLANGPHRVFARAWDTSGNQTDSAEVVTTVDSTAGLNEAEPDDAMADANAVPVGGTLITGTMTGVPGKPDVDFYKVHVAANATLVVDMLSTAYEGFQVQLLDANGTALTSGQLMTASEVNTVSYANGAAARDVFVRVTSIDADFSGRDRYRLTLNNE